MNKNSKLYSCKLLQCIPGLISFIFLCFLLYLNIFPLFYICVLVGIMILLNVILYYWNNKNNFITKILSVIFCVFMIFITVYLNHSIQTLDEITEVNNEISRISIIVKKDSAYQNIKDLEDKDIQINTKYNAVAMGATMNQLNELISCNYSSEDDFIKMATNLYDEDVDAILVNEAYLWVMEHKYEKFNDETRIIWTYEYREEKEDIKKPVVVESDCFNVFISGIDTRGDVSTVSRSDVNMIATVNTTTNQILLTSIPRDYYVYIPELKNKDKITHAGLNGVNSSVSTLENLMNLDINYYVKVNFTSLITMVDALGGIDVYSDYDLNYHPPHQPIIKGLNHMDGETALLFSRERYYLPNGDNDRILNQQRVIQGMLDKLISPAIITNYMDILDSVAGSFETNMSMKEITRLLKGQLENMKPWDVQSYSLSGTGSYFTGGAMMPDAELYYCVPDKNSVKKATDYINMMMDGEFIIVE